MPAFEGHDRTLAWQAGQRLDVAILVYNDKACAFDMKIMPALAIGCAEASRPADVPASNTAVGHVVWEPVT